MFLKVYDCIFVSLAQCHLLLQTSGQCQQCPDGMYCAVPGLAMPTGLCDAGYYCSGGSDSNNPNTVAATGGPCPEGTFCPNGTSSPKQCNAGTYNPIPLQDKCLDCPAGYFCEAGAANITECPTGGHRSGVWGLPYVAY